MNSCMSNHTMNSVHYGFIPLISLHVFIVYNTSQHSDIQHSCNRIQHSSNRSSYHEFIYMKSYYEFSVREFILLISMHMNSVQYGFILLISIHVFIVYITSQHIHCHPAQLQQDPAQSQQEFISYHEFIYMKSYHEFSVREFILLISMYVNSQFI